MELIVQNNYQHVVVDTSITGISDRSDYIPVYILLKSLHYESNSSNIIGNIFSYHKPLTKTKSFSTTRTFINVIKKFTYYDGLERFYFKINGDEYLINVAGGYISDINNNILLILTFKSSFIPQDLTELKKDVIEDSSGSIIYNRLRAFVSTELIKNPIYKNFYKRLDKEIIQFFYSKDIDVVFTTSDKIEEELFETDFNVTFDTIGELQNILESDLGSVLFQDVSEIPPTSISIDGSGIIQQTQQRAVIDFNLNEVDTISYEGELGVSMDSIFREMNGMDMD